MTVTHRDLSAPEHWHRSLERSRRRRALAADARKGASRRRGVSLALSATVAAAPAMPALAMAKNHSGVAATAPGTDTQGQADGRVVLEVGATGPLVSAVQRALGVAVDGVYGAETESAVLTFQRQQGLAATGNVDGHTFAALFPHGVPSTSPASTRPVASTLSSSNGSFSSRSTLVTASSSSSRPVGDADDPAAPNIGDTVAAALGFVPPARSGPGASKVVEHSPTPSSASDDPTGQSRESGSDASKPSGTDRGADSTSTPGPGDAERTSPSQTSAGEHPSEASPSSRSSGSDGSRRSTESAGSHESSPRSGAENSAPGGHSGSEDSSSGSSSGSHPGRTTVPSATAAINTMVRAADRIDAKHYSYLWGGGHNSSFRGPYDCSGAVSAVLHAAGLLAAPRVSGAFENYGSAGKGPVSIYANSSHVLMSLRGRFFGTSSSCPGGGACWLDSDPSADYLSRFVVRHAVLPHSSSASGDGPPERAKTTEALGGIGGPDLVMDQPGEATSSSSTDDRAKSASGEDAKRSGDESRPSSHDAAAATAADESGDAVRSSAGDARPSSGDASTDGTATGLEESGGMTAGSNTSEAPALASGVAASQVDGGASIDSSSGAADEHAKSATIDDATKTDDPSDEVSGAETGGPKDGSADPSTENMPSAATKDQGEKAAAKGTPTGDRQSDGKASSSGESGTTKAAIALRGIDTD